MAEKPISNQEAKGKRLEIIGEEPKGKEELGRPRGQWARQQKRKTIQKESKCQHSINGYAGIKFNLDEHLVLEQLKTSNISKSSGNNHQNFQNN